METKTQIIEKEIESLQNFIRTYKRRLRNFQVQLKVYTQALAKAKGNKVK